MSKSEAAASVEIERKFLVAKLPELSGLSHADVAQGYLTGSDDTVEIRVRKKVAKGKSSFFMTLKSDGGLERKEIEVAVSRDQFDAFWPATAGRRVEKTRYKGGLSGGLQFELDVFHGELDGLLLVEVEFTSVDAANQFSAPDWFGQDVTSNKGYKNKALAVKGRPRPN